MIQELPIVLHVDSPVRVRKQLTEVVQLLHLACSVGTETTLLLSLISVGAVTFVFATVSLASVAIACAVALGIPTVGWIASHPRTLLQKSVVEQSLGRVFGALSSTTALMLFVSSLSAGALRNLAGILPLMIVSAIAYCAAGLLALILIERPQTGG